MSKIGQRYFELKEQAEFYDMELDFETLEFIPKKPEPKKTYWQTINDNKDVDFDTRLDIDRE